MADPIPGKTIETFTANTRGFEHIAGLPANFQISEKLSMYDMVMSILHIANTPGGVQHSVENLSKNILHPNLSQSAPLFSEITAIPSGQAYEIRTHLNPETHHWVPLLEKQSDAYNKMEALGGGSGIIGISAAALEKKGNITDTEVTHARATLFDLLSGSITHAVVSMDQQTMATRMRDVFFSSVKPNNLNAAFVMTAVHGRGDLFPGYINAQNQFVMNEQNLGRWVNIWKQKSSEIYRKIASRQDISVPDIQFIEVLSHMFKIPETLTNIADYAITKNPPVKTPEALQTLASRAETVKFSTPAAQAVFDRIDAKERELQNKTDQNSVSFRARLQWAKTSFIKEYQTKPLANRLHTKKQFNAPIFQEWGDNAQQFLSLLTQNTKIKIPSLQEGDFDQTYTYNIPGAEVDLTAHRDLGYGPVQYIFRLWEAYRPEQAQSKNDQHQSSLGVDRQIMQDLNRTVRRIRKG